MQIQILQLQTHVTFSFLNTRCTKQHFIQSSIAMSLQRPFVTVQLPVVRCDMSVTADEEVIGVC